MKKSTTISLVISILLILSSLAPVMASDYPTWEEFSDNPARYIMEFVFGPDLNEREYQWNRVMQLVIFPLIAMFAVIYGIFSELNLFRSASAHNIKVVLSIAIGFGGGIMALRTMKTFIMVNSLLASLGFGIVLLIGIVFWAWSEGGHRLWKLTGWEMKSVKDARRREKQVEELQRLVQEEQRLSIAWQRALTHYDRTRADDIKDELERIRKDIQKLEKEIYGKELFTRSGGGGFGAGHP